MTDAYDRLVPGDVDGVDDEVIFASSPDAPRGAPSVPIRTRAAVAVDEALYSPRWDRIRGRVVIGCIAAVLLALGALATSAFVIGCAVLIRLMWGEVS